jgi:cobyric acid synthase
VSRGRARAIMLQGTGSYAGKTVLVAGLCRLLVLDARLPSDLGVS